MSEAIERPKTYEEGLRDGFIKGQEEANKVMEQMLQTSCNPIVYSMPETEAVKLLQEQIEKMKKYTKCEGCIHQEEHHQAIINGKHGSAICMLECNASHSCFELKE